MTQELVLKPCPACGSDNLAHVNPPDAPTSYYHVWCKACMLAGPQSDPSAAKWQALPRTSGDGARLRKLREWQEWVGWVAAHAGEYDLKNVCIHLGAEFSKALAEPEPQPVPAVAPVGAEVRFRDLPVAVPSHVREWCRWAADHYGPTDPEGANDGAVARWVLSLPTAPPAGRSAAPEGELERLRATHLDEVRQLSARLDACIDSERQVCIERDKLRSENESLRKERDEAIHERNVAYERADEKITEERDQLRATLRGVLREVARRDAT